MRLKLKEDPREWRRFALAGVVVFGTLVGLLALRNRIAPGTAFVAGTALVLVMGVAVLRPRWIRPVYRVAMTASFQIGQVVGRILLVVLFLTLVTPLGLFLRLTGRDLLRLKRDPSAVSYWRRARTSTDLDRQF